MQIQGLGQVHGAHGVGGPHFNRPAQATAGATPSSQVDQLDISPAAQAASEAFDTPGIRSDLVARIRSEIQNGSYETADKLDAALDRLLDQVG